jgi:hypothetical protein
MFCYWFDQKDQKEVVTFFTYMKNTLSKYILKLKTPMIILWCYLIWYFSMMYFYFEPSLKLWASALGISLIIGFALILSTRQNGIKQGKWVKFRLFLFPFCVSSYSATIKNHDFLLLFPSKTSHLIYGTLNCLFFVFLILVYKNGYKFYVKKKVKALNELIS